MKALKNLSLLLLLVLAFTGCHNKSSKLADFNRTVYTPEYASGFDIKGADGKKSVLVTVTIPWQGADSITTNLFIARDDEEVPADFTGQMLKGDAERIVCMSSTHIAMLDAIGETGRVVGVSGIDYISNPDIQARRDSVGDVGYEGNINYELLLSLDPDLVLLYGVNGASSMEGKLKELDIPFMYVGDYLEESPLGKAEWLVALSEVIGKRAEGALDRKLCRPVNHRCRRRLHLQEEHRKRFRAHRPRRGVSAGLASRYVAACGDGEHA